MSILFTCPKCNGSITTDMKNCIHCGTELVPISIKSQPIASANSYGYSNSYRPSYYSHESYEKKKKANLGVMILFVLLLGILSAFGYYLIATGPSNSTKTKIFGLILIIVSIILNLIFLYR